MNPIGCFTLLVLLVAALAESMVGQERGPCVYAFLVAWATLWSALGASFVACRSATYDGFFAGVLSGCTVFFHMGEAVIPTAVGGLCGALAWQFFVALVRALRRVLRGLLTLRPRATRLE